MLNLPATIRADQIHSDYMTEHLPYQIGTQILQLPPDHQLPIYQAHHPLYERFPFFLASLCKPHEWIVDVGANIGDTTAAFVQSTMGSILAVEAHPPYFEILERNIEGLPQGMKSRVRTVNALAGTGTISGSLVASNGTATVIPGGSSTPVPLDTTLQQQGIAPESVAVLKTDTDGYDADVILSAPELLTAGSPVLYFENRFDNDGQLGRYEAMYAELSRLKYNLFSVFDNFGNLMLDIAPVYFLSSLNKYLKAQNLGKGTRTVYYYDVLAFREERAESVARTLSNYRSFILRVQ